MYVVSRLWARERSERRATFALLVSVSLTSRTQTNLGQTNRHTKNRHRGKASRDQQVTKGFEIGLSKEDTERLPNDSRPEIST